jgi:hypothetical protein
MLACTASAGCVSGSGPINRLFGDRAPASSVDIAEAQSAIDQAERAGAQRYANFEINQARETLARARQAEAEGDQEQAARLAERAMLDAEYAAASVAYEETRNAVREQEARLQTLRSNASSLRR